jgi:hypothetical protein
MGCGEARPLQTKSEVAFEAYQSVHPHLFRHFCRRSRWLSSPAAAQASSHHAAVRTGCLFQGPALAGCPAQCLGPKSKCHDSDQPLVSLSSPHWPRLWLNVINGLHLQLRSTLVRGTKEHAIVNHLVDVPCTYDRLAADTVPNAVLISLFSGATTKELSSELIGSTLFQVQQPAQHSSRHVLHAFVSRVYDLSTK